MVHTQCSSGQVIPGWAGDSRLNVAGDVLACMGGFVLAYAVHNSRVNWSIALVAFVMLMSTHSHCVSCFIPWDLGAQIDRFLCDVT